MLADFFNRDKRALNTPLRSWPGQRVWIIGASSGIGAALAVQLLEAGATVALSARRAGSLQQVAAGRPRAIVLPFDAQDDASWKSASEQITAQCGGVDLIIFCAAQYRPEHIWEVDPATARLTLQVNLGSIYSGLATILPAMLQRGQGGIALVASVAGYMGLPKASVYGPSKAGMINLAENLYGDLHPKGINVYLINPGFVDTGLTQKNSFAMPALQTPEQASASILRGFAAGQFEIHFPKRFTQMVKLVRLLPYRLRFYLFNRYLYDPTQ